MSRIVGILLKYNAKITAVKGSKMTPLHIAVKQTSTEYPIELVMNALLREQTATEVNSRESNTQTPLHYAAVCCNNYPNVIKLLLDK